MKSDGTYKVEVLKDSTTSVEVEVVEKIAPREVKLSLALDFARRRLEGQIIKEKGFEEIIEEKDVEENIEILEFNSLDETGRLFLGVIEGNINFKVLQFIIFKLKFLF